MTDAAGNVTTYEYNYANLMVRLIRAGGRTGEPGSFVYDFSKITAYTYTADGRVSTVTDRNGAVTVCVYDIHGNLLSRTVTEGGTTQSISYTYDSNGNVLTMTDGTGTTTRTYDVWNRTTTKTVPNIGTSFYTYDITDGFDAGCSAESTVDPKGNVTVKVYDRVGRLIYVLADSMTTAYAYYDDGSLQSVVYGNGSREDYTYTADKLLKTLVNKAIDGTIIDSYEYTYDAAHNLLSKTDSKGATGYTYDAQNRILTVTEPSGKITAYTYDAAGNRSSMTETEGSDITATVYTYDAMNRLVRTTETLNGTLVRTADYAYDNNGNLLTVTSVTYTDGIAGAPVLEQNNTYDLLNQLIRTVTSDGTTVENTYNGDGYRVVKSVNGSATRFLYQYDKIVLEVNALGDQTSRNVYGLNLISRTFGEDTFFYFYNGHADVTALLASDGTIAATYCYDAFGNILDQTGTATSNILYAGYQYDPETGLYYLNARMYDPITARFIQEDSYLGSRNDALSLNLYTYCHNEPMMYADTSGHREVEGIEIGGHTEPHTMKPGEATAEYYKTKYEGTTKKSATLDAYEYSKTTKKGLTENAISSGKSGMPSEINNVVYSYYNATQEELDGLNEFLSPLPPIDRSAIYKMIMMAGEPYRTAMIETLSSGYYKLKDASKEDCKWYYDPGFSLLGIQGEVCVDFTNLDRGGCYDFAYSDVFHEIFHAVDNNGLSWYSDTMNLTTAVNDEMSELLFMYINNSTVDYAKSHPGLSDDTAQSIYDIVKDTENNDLQMKDQLSNTQIDILLDAYNKMNFISYPEYTCAYDMLGGVTNNFRYTLNSGQKIKLGGGHYGDENPPFYDLDGYYFYDSYLYLNEYDQICKCTFPNNVLGEEFFAESASINAVGPDTCKVALHETLHGASKMVEDYLIAQYIA